MSLITIACIGISCTCSMRDIIWHHLAYSLSLLSYLRSNGETGSMDLEAFGLHLRPLGQAGAPTPTGRFEGLDGGCGSSNSRAQST